MILIESAAELDAISGGRPMVNGSPLSRITCTIGNKGSSCTGSVQDFLEVGFAAFDQLQEWGGEFGCWVYDVTH